MKVSECRLCFEIRLMTRVCGIPGVVRRYKFRVLILECIFNASLNTRLVSKGWFVNRCEMLFESVFDSPFSAV